MPYYVGDNKNPEFQHRKRLFAMSLLAESGLLNHLSALEGAKVVIIFGRRKDLKRIHKMIPYIIEGDFIKGSIEDLGVKIEAEV